ncbi:phosphodiesterase, MJ0936 family [Mycobacterium xenopi 4042]|uniref:Phosphodiesterase, MJ0936 family n=1 Tax=Mycobacterium xenopi 4042 TaxID=1299334 RepID=X8CKP5_MYCXE|nr:phosphodiesterase, MJ0936 family [Mycobacterium xenopi 4042]
MRLLLLADTHIPQRARDLPARVWDEVAATDVVVHAGTGQPRNSSTKSKLGRAGWWRVGETTTGHVALAAAGASRCHPRRRAFHGRA